MKIEFTNLGLNSLLENENFISKQNFIKNEKNDEKSLTENFYKNIRKLALRQKNEELLEIYDEYKKLIKSCGIEIKVIILILFTIHLNLI
jgi:hypothetical protein